MKEKMQKTFADAVKSQIGGNRQHGWGVDDSMAVIDVMIAEFADEIDKAKGLPEELTSFIKAVINPSQFRQTLEGKLGLLDKSVGKGAKIDATFAGF